MLDKMIGNKDTYDSIVSALRNAVNEHKWLSPQAFIPHLEKVLADVVLEKKILDKIADSLSVMDKAAEVQLNRKGEIIYDKETKDIERVPFSENIDVYMTREVLPHIPDAKAFFEEDLSKSKPILKTGAEIPFTRYFYTYTPQKSAEIYAQEFAELEKDVDERIASLFGEVQI